MKLLVPRDAIAEVAEALYLDQVPAVLMERTGPGWHIEFMRHAPCPHVLALVERGVVQHR
jgi:hypothetical protein